MIVKVKGYVIINKNHPRNPGSEQIYTASFRTSKKACISDFVQFTGDPWRKWYRKWNFRCVPAVVDMTTLEKVEY